MQSPAVVCKHYRLICFYLEFYVFADDNVVSCSPTFRGPLLLMGISEGGAMNNPVDYDRHKESCSRHYFIWGKVRENKANLNQFIIKHLIPYNLLNNLKRKK